MELLISISFGSHVFSRFSDFHVKCWAGGHTFLVQYVTCMELFLFEHFECGTFCVYIKIQVYDCLCLYDLQRVDVLCDVLSLGRFVRSFVPGAFCLRKVLGRFEYLWCLGRFVCVSFYYQTTKTSLCPVLYIYL